MLANTETIQNRQNQTEVYNGRSEPIMARLNADNSNKKAVLAFWLIFSLLLIAVFVTSNFTPESFIIKNNRSELSDTHHKDCSNPVQFDNGLLVCKDFSNQNPKLGLIMRNLSPLNQFAQINLIFLPGNNTEQQIQITQRVKVELMSLQRKQISINENQKVIAFEKGEDVNIMDIEFNSQEYEIKDVIIDENQAARGYQVSLGYYRQFKTKDALLVVHFVDIKWDQFKQYEIFTNAILANPNYTIFTLIMRGAFVGLMSLAFVYFYYKLRRNSSNQRSQEQQLVIILSVVIILFNDPYYFVEVFFPNIISVFIETIFAATFIIVLLFSWVYLLNKINCQSRDIKFSLTLNMKILYGIVTFICFWIIFAFNYLIGYFAFSETPIIPFHHVFHKVYIATVVLFCLIFAYIFYLYIRILQVWSDLLWRNKLYVTFNIFFVFLLLIFISMGWFSIYDESSQKFEILYASMNIYVLYLQYMYSVADTPPKYTNLHEQFQEVGTISDSGPSKAENFISINLEDEPKIQMMIQQ